MKPHPDLRIQKLTIGRELAPLAVIDNLVADADELVEMATTKMFGGVASHYPGVRAKAPLTYHQFVIGNLRELFVAYFGLASSSLRVTSCHFSVVTTPPEKLEPLQTIPHIDSSESNQLAFVHYLFRRDLGGTAFYRHRRTGFEFIDAARKEEYFAYVAEERMGPDKPAQGYINGDTALYEQIGRQDGVFNRMLVYRRNSLHSGCIGPEFEFNPDPRKGRLSLNGFLA
jgi:hypothetical protein